MTHLKPINRKAGRIVEAVAETRSARLPPPPKAPVDHRSHGEGGQPSEDQTQDVVALQQGPPQQPQPHFPLGCSLVFSPGWEADSNGGTAGLCQPVERDIFDCHVGCFWPAQVPDQLNHAPDWTAKCASAQKDWRKLDLVFPG